MLDHNILSLLKPKRLYEDKYCIISKNNIKIDYGAITVVAPFQSSLPPIKISVKDLWSGNLDEARPIDPVDIKIPSPICWREILINITDETVFSSISSIGEDTFLLGQIEFCFSGRFDIKAYGLTWSSFYSTVKNNNTDTKGFSIYFDWYIFYHLFQMFKDLSGKKTSTLLWHEDANYIYFTNLEKEYYIICNKTNSLVDYKKNIIKSISTKYSTLSFVRKTDITKKILQEQYDAEIKHLLRPFPDIVTKYECDLIDKYTSDYYSLFVTKENRK